jgi:hypothetical protein
MSAITNLCVLLMMKMFIRKDVYIFDTRELVGSYRDNFSMFLIFILTLQIALYVFSHEI